MRYIDADKLVEMYERSAEDDWNKKTAPSSWAEAFECAIVDIDDQPTADVVPKSEVEALEREIERLKKSMLPSYYSACTEEEAIKRGKQYGRAEVAREIFEEIEKIMETLIYDYRKVSRYQDGDTVWYVKDFLLAELKKKYAGDNKE